MPRAADSHFGRVVWLVPFPFFRPCLWKTVPFAKCCEDLWSLMHRWLLGLFLGYEKKWGFSMYQVPYLQKNTHGDKLRLQVLMQAIVLLVHIDGLPWEQARSHHFQSKQIEMNQVNHCSCKLVNTVPWQVYDAVEVFAGVGMLSRCLQLANFETASLDIKHWDPFTERRLCKRLRKPACNGNPLDLLSPAGMAFLDSCNWEMKPTAQYDIINILYNLFQHGV